MKELSPAEVVEWLKTDKGREWSNKHVWPIKQWYSSRPGVFGSLLPLSALEGECHEYRPWNEVQLHFQQDFLYEPRDIPKNLSSPAL